MDRARAGRERGRGRLRRKVASAAGALVAALLLVAPAARAADDLHLAPGLSFTDDSSTRFPIEGRHLGDAEVGGGRATLVFFGAAHCWNTNREAERVVALYPRYRDRVRFVVVDVEHPADAQRALVARLYRGAIPTVAVLAPGGDVLYARAGETAGTRGDTSRLAGLLDDALAR